MQSLARNLLAVAILIGLASGVVTGAEPALSQPALSQPNTKETKQQFDEAGLTPVDGADVPVVIPEPATLSLMFAGLASLWFGSRRRRKGRRK